MDLRIEHLSKTYPNGVRALDDVSLTIPHGMYGLLGPNGAGKSTLMRTIATLQEPDSGEIWLGDINVLKQKEELRKKLGYLPQDFGVYPRISVQDMLDHLALLKGFTHRGERQELVESLLIANQPAGCPQESALGILGRHAAAFRYRAGAHRQSAVADRG